MEFGDLNDDCVRAIFDYLPSSQLFAVCTSRDLKKQQIHRCAIDTLLRARSPFRIKPSFARPSPQNRAAPQALAARSRILLLPPPDVQTCWLLDADSQRVGEIKRPRLFRESSLSEQVRDLELPIELLVDADTNLADFWLDLASCLPESAAISAFIRDPSGSFFDPTADALGDRLRKNAEKFRPILPMIRSFTVPAATWCVAHWLELLRPTDLFAVLDEMPALVSLSVPVSFFSSAASAFSASPVAQRLTELRIVKPSVPAPIPCLQLLESIARVGCLNLAVLHVTCSCYWGMPNATGTLECLRKLPQLRKLAICDRCTLAHAAASNAPIPLRDLHLEIGRHYTRPGNFAPFLSQFTQLRNVRISLVSGLEPSELSDLLRASFNVPSIKTDLCELTIDAGQSPILLPPRDLGQYALLQDDLTWCLKLDHVDLTGIVFRFSGFPTESPDMTACGYWHLGPIIRALETNLTLRSVKLSAIFDSSEALKSQLPENCYIAKLSEKPKSSFSRRYVLHPDTYWQPLEILVVCERKNYGVKVENFSDKLFLRIINRSQNTIC